MKKRKIVRLMDRKEQEDWMKCPFCPDHKKIPVDPDWIEQHLIVILDKSFHYHVHGPVGDKQAMKLFILKIAKEANIEIEDDGGKENGREDEPQIIESRKLKNKITKKKSTKEKIIEEDSAIPDEPA